MKATPNAQHLGEMMRNEAINTDLLESRDERARLHAAMAAGEQAMDQLVDLEGLHEELLDLAQDAHAEARSGYEVARDKLEVYDAESERLLAETGGRVQSLHARIQLSRFSDGSPCVSSPTEIAALEAELLTAQLADQQRVTERLSGREWLARECRALRMAVLTAGQARLALSAAYVPSLRTIHKAGLAARERHNELMKRSETSGKSVIDQLNVLRLITPRPPVVLRAGEPDAGAAAVQPDRNGGTPAC